MALKSKSSVIVYLFLPSLVFIASISLNAQADPSSELLCRVEHTDDVFQVYPNQLIYNSKQFSIYQLIDGLTVLIVNSDTMRFNRISNINLLASSTLDPSWPAEPYQYFTGQCEGIAPARPE